jgi:hypothetical protein
MLCSDCKQFNNSEYVIGFRASSLSAIILSIQAVIGGSKTCGRVDVAEKYANGGECESRWVIWATNDPAGGGNLFASRPHRLEGRIGLEIEQVQ